MATTSQTTPQTTKSFFTSGTASQTVAEYSKPAESVALSVMRFHGATSVLGGSNYQMGRLNFNVSTLDGNSTITAVKTNPSKDVDVSNFSNTGTLSTTQSTSFFIRAIGNRNLASSSLQGGSTDDSVGINGGRPGKIDIAGTNRSEKLVFEIHDLDPAFTFRLKNISVTQVTDSSDPTQPTAVVLTGFDGNEANYYLPSGSAPTDITSFNSFGSQPVTVVGAGSGVAGSFKVGIDGADASSYGLYSIDFDIE